MPTTTKKPAAKKPAGKAPADKPAAAKARPKSAAKAAGTKAASAKPSAAGKKAPAKKAAGSSPDTYTDPKLRDRLKAKILAGEKGGRAGQWSARKAQLLAHEYEAAGGGYKGKKSATQKHLDEWAAEGWTTADGKPAERGKTTARYLPKKAWEELSPEERKKTDAKKRAASRAGKQHVANTPKAKAARKKAEKG